MRNRAGKPVNTWRKLFLATAGAAALIGSLWAPLWPQSPAAQSPRNQSPTPRWQTDAGGKMAFDVASVKQNKSNDPANSNVAMGPGDYYSPNGGFFTATNTPLFRYIMFAYKVTANQMQALLAQLPKWVTTDNFDIQARAEVNPTKDQMRLMMQSLLAHRFKLAIHSETRQLPVFGLVLEKPGRIGPQLRAHPDGTPCSTDPQLPSSPGSAPAAPATVAGGFPATCGGIQPMPASAPGRVRMGGRNVTMGLIASTLAATPDGPDRPVLDKTGLSGMFDFTLDWTPQFNGSPPPNFQPDATGPTFLQALQEQLGLKLEARTGPVDVILVDHVEQPSEN